MVMKVLTNERRVKIRELVEKNEFVTLRELVQRFQVSESTIRRDLHKLDQIKSLQRVHGGASKLPVMNRDIAFSKRSLEHLTEKREIGKYAAQLIQENDTIYIDAGTTTFELLSFINLQNLRVITNSIYHAQQLMIQGISPIVLGGQVNQVTGAIVGSVTGQQLKGYYFSKAFIGINGIHPDHGLTTTNMEEASLKQIVLQNSNKTYILADSSKLNKVSFCKVEDLKGQQIISNQTKSQGFAHLKNKIRLKEVGQ